VGENSLSAVVVIADGMKAVRFLMAVERSGEWLPGPAPGVPVEARGSPITSGPGARGVWTVAPVGW